MTNLNPSYALTVLPRNNGYLPYKLQYYCFLNVENLEPEVKILSLTIVSPGREDLVLPLPEDGDPKGLWFTLKEGSPYTLRFCFQVSNNLVSGLRYMNTVWKTGLKGT